MKRSVRCAIRKGMTSCELLPLPMSVSMTKEERRLALNWHARQKKDQRVREKTRAYALWKSDINNASELVVTSKWRLVWSSEHDDFVTKAAPFVINKPKWFFVQLTNIIAMAKMVCLNPNPLQVGWWVCSGDHVYMYMCMRVCVYIYVRLICIYTYVLLCKGMDVYIYIPRVESSNFSCINL